MHAGNYLQTLLQLDRSLPDFPDQLCAVLDGMRFYDYIASLEPDGLLELVEYLDEVRSLLQTRAQLLNTSQALGDLDHTTAAFRGTLRKLQAVCASRSVLPSSHVLSNDQLNVDNEPFASGGYSSVYKGTLSGLDVCVKGSKVASAGDLGQARKAINQYKYRGPVCSQISQMLYREAVRWKRLTHPNIVPFRGVTLDPLQIVSEWMSGGDLTSYVSLNPQADRIGLVSPFRSFPEIPPYFLSAGRRRNGASLPPPS